MNTSFPDQAAAPRVQISETESLALELDSYIMHVKSQECSHCASGAQWGELYEVWTHPTKTRSTGLHVLRPTTVLRPGFPVSYTHLPKRSVPVCSDCVETYQPVSAPAAIGLSREAWAETLRRKYAPSSEPTKGKPEPSLDSL